MHARSGRLQVSAEQIDDVVRVMTEDQIAMFHGQPGYRGFTGLADRENGTVMGISFWETEADMRAGEQLGREARRRAGEAGGTRGEPVVDRWEVVFDEMV
jgi:heme-degrading monooxygenase HmoA